MYLKSRRQLKCSESKNQILKEISKRKNSINYDNRLLQTVYEVDTKNTSKIVKVILYIYIHTSDNNRC